MTDRATPPASPSASQDERRWNAVLDRDDTAEPSFRYGVVSTGVYCRPGCPSRRPRRENVRFFDTPAQAEAAGFRPCRRCRPAQDAPDQERLAMIKNICRRIEAEPGRLSLAELAREAGMSPWHFQRLFKAAVGLTPRQYGQACREQRLRDSLGQGEDVSQAIYGAGFGSPSRVYERSGSMLGMSPAAFRRGGAGERIRHAAAKTSLGWVLMAATGKGVCAMELADSPAGHAERLASRFPKAEIIPADHELQDWLAQVTAALDTPGRPALPDLPLDIRGSAFQHLVWHALQRIPPGRTTTYSALATAIGRPTAVRAVAAACASNPLAIIVPCHRVLGKNGALTGYRWGLERKQALLQREAPNGNGEGNSKDEDASGGRGE